MNIPFEGKWQDVIKGSVATLVLFLGYVTLPLVGIAPGLFVPLPALFYALKDGMANGIAIVAITAAVLTVVTGVQTAALYSLQCAIISLVLAGCLRAGKGGARAIASTVAINSAVLLLLAGIFTLARGVDINHLVVRGINDSISQSLVIYEKGGLKGDELKTMEQVLRQGGEFIGRVYPALVIVSLALIAGLNVVVIRRFAPRFTAPPAVGELKDFRNPEQLVWPLIVAGFAMLLDSRVVTDVALNALVVILSLYFMQGLAVIVHFFERFRVPVPMRWFFYVFLALQPYLSVAVAALGVFDIWGDFRTPKQRENL